MHPNRFHHGSQIADGVFQGRIASCLAATDDLGQQPLGLPLQRQNVGADLLQCAQRLRLVEVAGEADLVADLDALGVVPGIGCVGQHLAAQERLDATFFQQRHLLGVAQVGVGLVFDHGRLAVDGRLEQTVQRVGLDLPVLWIFLMTGGASSAALGRRPLSALISFGRVGSVRVDALEPQRPLDRHLPVAEGGVGEDLRLLGLLEGEESVADAVDVLVGQLAVLLAQVLAQRLEPLRGVDELHLALAVRGLAVGEHPDVGGDAGVVKHVERQGDDGFEPVVLDDPAADVALALAGVAGEERRAVVDLGDAAAELACRASSC